ncbi:hypothetical protein ACFQVC_17645 [Streptomyces monticola]|uniref:Serine/threonine protein kinase n=1 Tax=Streptomyces monticola TaxID=2666263 RepID=A0ABW2JL10_9ACTN
MTALTAAVALAAFLPLAGAVAGPLGDSAPEAVRGDEAVRADRDVRDGGEALQGDDIQDGERADDAGADDAGADGKQPEKQPQGQQPEGQPEKSAGPGLLSGLGLTTAAHCGPELASPEGVEAQTCVLSQARDTWARTYYRNATGGELRSVLTLMGPGGRTVQMHCVVTEGDEPGACETPKEPSQGEPADYTAVAEFAAPQGGDGETEQLPLLLRSGSNSTRTTGS